MELIASLLKITFDYIMQNSLHIDKSTFFTVIIGQITIYGILLTFYQFVASYQEGGKATPRYLGNKITEYIIRKNINIFNNNWLGKFLGILLLLEILYKPFVTIYGKLLGIKIVCILNFVWYFSVVLYFLIFVNIFLKCTKSIRTIKNCSDKKINEFLIIDINNSFLKKLKKEGRGQSSIDFLKQKFYYLHNAINEDDNPELQDKYNDLLYIIFNDYTNQKEYEISIIENKGRILKNQVYWSSNAYYEARLLIEIIEQKYFQLDEVNINYIVYFYMYLLKLNLKRAKLEGYNKVSCNKYEGVYSKSDEKVFDISEWKNVMGKLYQKVSDKNKQGLIYSLHLYMMKERKMDFYEYYCKDCIASLIVNEIDYIFEEEREQEDFVKIFGQVIKEEYFNDFFAEILKEKIVSYNRFDLGKLIPLLSEKNCTYIFIYIVNYYSIYRSKNEWEYINLKLLKMLWKNCGRIKNYKEEVLKRVKNSNMGYRFNDEIYIKFMEYLDADVEGKLFNKVYTDKILKVFYFFVLKLCVINEYDVMYSGKIDINPQITIINELSKHEELMKNNSIISCIGYMRHNTFAELNYLPEKLNITLRSLLMTNINVDTIVNSLSGNYYCYNGVFGRYLLIKLYEFIDENNMNKSIQEIVKKAFIVSNMSIDEYINKIEEECQICGYDINYVQKEKMKEHLIKII